MVGDDDSGSGAAGDDEIAQQRGVATIVGAAEVDRDAFGEERRPGHGKAAVWVPRRSRVEILLGVYPRDPEMPGRVDQPGQVLDDLGGLLRPGPRPVVGLEADRVSVPQMALEVTRTTTSVGSSTTASETSSTMTDRVSANTTTFMTSVLIC